MVWFHDGMFTGLHESPELGSITTDHAVMALYMLYPAPEDSDMPCGAAALVEIHTVNTRERATGRNVLLLAYP
jgi:hypothetical protein